MPDHHARVETGADRGAEHHHAGAAAGVSVEDGHECDDEQSMQEATGMPTQRSRCSTKRASVLFIGSQFSNLYTAVDTLARGRVVCAAAPAGCHSRRRTKWWRRKLSSMVWRHRRRKSPIKIGSPTPGASTSLSSQGRQLGLRSRYRLSLVNYRFFIIQGCFLAIQMGVLALGVVPSSQS